jgi:hypothetical protein
MRNLFDGNTWEIDILGAYDEGGKPFSAWGLQVESGIFTQTGNTVNFSTTKSSCWGAGSFGSGQFWRTYEFGSFGGQTTLRWDGDVHVLMREVKQPVGMVFATIGCFDNYYDDFTPHAIQSK